MKPETGIQEEIGVVRLWRDRYKYLTLLVFLIVLIILFPYFERNFLDRTFLKILITLIVVAGIFSVSDTVRKFALALVLAVPFIILSSLYLNTHVYGYEIAATVFLLLFFIAATVMVLVAVLSEQRISHDAIFGAISVYILMGFTWGIGYQVLQLFEPAAFSVSTPVSGDHIMYFSDHIAYSFSCLTTLGSNDVLPVSSFAKTLITFEAICGTLYLAVLIAWLMGVFILHRQREGCG